MKTFSHFISEQILKENSWKRIAGTYDNMTAPARRAAQAGNAGLPSLSATRKAVVDAARKAANRKMGAIPASVVSQAVQGKAGLGAIQQAAKKSLAFDLSQQAQRQANILNKFKGTGKVNPANKIRYGDVVPTSDPNYMMSIGKAVNTGKGRLPGPDVITSGGTIKRPLATGLATKDIATGTIEALSGGPLAAPVKAGAGAAAKVAARGANTLRNILQGPKAIRRTGALPLAVTGTGTMVGGGQTTKTIKKMVDPKGTLGVTKTDVISGIGKSIPTKLPGSEYSNNLTARQAMRSGTVSGRGTGSPLKLTGKEIGALGTAFAGSKEGTQTAVGLGMEVAGGFAAPVPTLATRIPGAPQNITKDVKRGAANLVGAQNRPELGNILQPGNPDYDINLATRGGTSGLAKVGTNIRAAAAARQASQAQRINSQRAKDAAKAAYQANQKTGGLTGRNMPKSTMSLSTAIQRGSQSRDPNVQQRLDYLKRQARAAHVGDGLLSKRGYLSPPSYTPPKDPKETGGFLGTLFKALGGS